MEVTERIFPYMEGFRCYCMCVEYMNLRRLWGRYHKPQKKNDAGRLLLITNNDVPRAEIYQNMIIRNDGVIFVNMDVE